MTGVHFPARAENFLAAASSPTLVQSQPPTKCVPGAVFLGLEWQGREADHMPQYTAEAKNARSYASTHSCLHGMVLRDWFPLKRTER
jgi:hypothetical protein